MLRMTMSWDPWMGRLRETNLLGWKRTLASVGRLGLHVGRGYERDIGCEWVVLIRASREGF